MSGTSISFFYALVYAVWGCEVPGGVEGGRFSGNPVSGAALETGLPENLRASRREGRPGTLLAKLSVVQNGRQADICPVAWDIVWGFILLDFGCKKDIFYIEIIGFMVY